MKYRMLVGAGLFSLSAASTAVAEEEPSNGAVPLDADAEPTKTAAEPQSIPARAGESSAPLAPPGPSDHDRRVGRLSAAFFGTRAVPNASAEGASIVLDGDGSATLTVTPGTSTVPLLGMRAWLSRSFGLDVGVGVGFESERAARYVPNPDPTKDRQEDAVTANRTTLAVHLGTPIALTSGAHHTLMLIPEVDVGYGRLTLPGYQASTTGAPLDLRLTGLGVAAGARLAAELAFGFWGVPELSLQTSWGVGVQYRKHTGRIGDAEHTISATGLSTSTAGDAWQAVSGAFALLYGF